MDDNLAQLRDNFFAGYYKRCLELAGILRSHTTELERGELESITLRAASAINRERGQTPGPSHLDVSTVATVNFLDYWHSDSKERKIHHLSELRDRAQTTDNVARFLASCALCKEGTDTDLIEALRFTTHGPTETDLLRTMELILANRYDLAQQLSRSLSSANDDAVITKLAAAPMSLINGNYQEAYLTYGDVQVQCCEGEETEGSSSILLLNGKAVANMEQRHWVEAVEDLQKAYRQDPRDIDTIMNLIICYKWLKDEEECQKYQTLLADLDHQNLAEVNKVQQSFAKFRALRKATAAT